MEPLFRAGDMALLDCSEAARGEPEATGCYVVESSGQGLVRRVRRGGVRLYLTALDNPNPLPWDFISLADRHILEVVKAKVVWIGRNPESLALASKSIEQTG
jgi:phage repressor protein C with HTH and peptisase S24 domain